jgi:hypothetical protein
MKYNVTFEFEGEKAKETAEKFYIWVVDGGLDQEIEQTMTNDGYPIYMDTIDNEKRSMIWKTGQEPAPSK